MNTAFDNYECFDKDHPIIVELTKSCTDDTMTNIEKAINIYLKVRDEWYYYPYNIKSNPEGYLASNIAQREKGHCIDKAILMIACLRCAKIPARIGFAKVTNHIATEKLEEKLGSNILVPHGYVDIFLEGKWVKATPAFNRSLCEKLNVTPLEFDGHNDSVFQEFDQTGATFMEYLEDYGTFEEVPFSLILGLMQKYYPRVFKRGGI